MARDEQFNTNIKQPLLQMKNEVESLNIEGLDDNQRLEFARANKVLEYIENYINLLDPDLLPQTFYNQIQSKIQSWNTLNKTIPTLNSILDEILFYLASYGSIYIPKNQASAIIGEIIKAYNDTIKDSLQEINFNKIKKDAKSIENYEHSLLSAEDSIQKQIAISYAQIQTWFNEIQKFNHAFFVKQDNKETSIKADIDFIQNDINSTYKRLNDIVTDYIQKLTDLDKFYVKIFGTVENNQRVGGLEQEIEDRLHQLNQYNEEQKTKFKSLKDEIESLLKDATNASLASSYEKSKESYRNSIISWNIAFMFSMFGILGVAIWAFVEVADRLEPLVVLGAILVRLPLYIPLTWLAIFATRRRNEIKRLQEEYKHKETLARSFLGFKEQIDKIQDTQKEILTAKLMKNLVEMTNENPNKSLDKTSKENIPTLELGEKTLNWVKDIISMK